MKHSRLFTAFLIILVCGNTACSQSLNKKNNLAEKIYQSSAINGYLQLIGSRLSQKINSLKQDQEKSNIDYLKKVLEKH